MDRIVSFVQRVHQGHESLKDRIHNGWRYPLPPWGRFVMGCVYFSIPTILIGYPSWQMVQAKAKQNLGEHGENLQSVQGIGDKRPLQDGAWGRVGAGGWGGGNRLVVSDAEAQKEYSAKIKAFLRKQQQQQQQQRKLKEEEAKATNAAQVVGADGSNDFSKT